MHHAPAVTYPVTRCPLWASLLTGVWLLGLFGITAWFLLQHPPLRHLVIALSSLTFSAACAAHFLWRQPATGHLSWDGEHWRSTPGTQERPGHISVHADWQWALLVRWHADGLAPRWFWLRRKLQAERWADLRRAVYSSTRVVN